MYVKIPLNNLRLTDVNPRVCGRRTCPPGYTIGPSMRDHYTLHYVIQGTGTYTVAGNTYQLQGGDIFVIRPWEKCAYTSDTEDPWEYIWVGFDCSDSFGAMLSIDVFHMPSALPIFVKMAEGEAEGVREWSVCAQLYELFAKLAALQLPAGVRSEDYVGRAVNYIQSNYSQTLQVAEIAAALGLSRNYFCRLFHQHVGVSPQAYIVSYRLERAAEFMTVHNLSQKEAAIQAGYPDVYAFSRMFKRKYGMAPGAYVAAQRAAEK